MLAGLGEAGLVGVVSVLGLDGCEVLDGFVGAGGVEPVDSVQGGGFDVVEALPGAVGVDEF